MYLSQIGDYVFKTYLIIPFVVKELMIKENVKFALLIENSLKLQRKLYYTRWFWSTKYKCATSNPVKL